MAARLSPYAEEFWWREPKSLLVNPIEVPENENYKADICSPVLFGTDFCIFGYS